MVLSVWLRLYGCEFVFATLWLQVSSYKSMVASLCLLVYGECGVWLRVHGCDCKPLVLSV
jgi:hypothetical protein